MEPDGILNGSKKKDLKTKMNAMMGNKSAVNSSQIDFLSIPEA
jgi:hypothetical protein